MAGAPIDAPPLTWTWIDFPDTRCANGSPTGLAVNLVEGSDRVLVFTEGGGGCWDYETCYELGFAVNLNGYSGADFAQDRPYTSLPLFDREDPQNPLSDASYVYIPYCTGDVHTGSNVVDLSNGTDTITTYFVGADNQLAYLNRLVPTFEAADRVWLSGWSAGGFGAAFNWGRYQDAFGTTRVDLLDDSGQPIEPGNDLWATWLDAWQVPFPAGCTTCEDSLGGIMDYYLERFDGRNRMGLLSYSKDSVITFYMQLTWRRFNAELMNVAHSEFDGTESFRYFIVSGYSHVLLSTPERKASNGLSVYDWVNQMVEDDPAWESVEP
jgi:hypothetical protein